MKSITADVWFAPPSEADRFLLEGPREFGDGLIWVNIQTAGDAITGDLWTRGWSDVDAVRHEMPARPGFVLPTSEPDVVLVGCDKVIGRYDLASREWLPLAAIPDTHPRTIINDGEFVPGGEAMVFGTKDVQFAEPIADLYLFTLADQRVTILRDGQTCSNGKVFAKSDRGLILYDIDTPRKVVTRYLLDVNARTLVDDGIAIDLRDRADFPDGMTDGGDGTVIIAFYNPALVSAGEAVRFELRTGLAVERWLTPGSPRVTCPLLVTRPDGVKLILTTAVEGMPLEMRAQCPNAGAIFIADVA